MAIPHTVNPGNHTVYYYNTQIFQELGIQETNDWATFHEEMQKVKEAGYTAFAPASTDANGWDIQFSLSPYYAISFQDQWDQDGNEIMSTRESTRSIYNGVWYMETNPAVFEMYSLVKDKLQNTCDEGYEGIDYTQAWKDGQVAIIEDGIWRFPTENSNTERTFDFGMMAPPVIQTSEYVDPVEFTEAGPYKPQPMEALTIVKASQQGRPEYQEDYVVDLSLIHI